MAGTPRATKFRYTGTKNIVAELMMGSVPWDGRGDEKINSDKKLKKPEKNFRWHTKFCMPIRNCLSKKFRLQLGPTQKKPFLH